MTRLGGLGCVEIIMSTSDMVIATLFLDLRFRVRDFLDLGFRVQVFLDLGFRFQVLNLAHAILWKLPM